jgi:hypothetical protein
MSARRFDDAARILASGLPRRRVVGLLARAAVGVTALLASAPQAGAQPGCRREGHPCEGNQTCCAGLICTESGPGAARRCTAGRTTGCEGDCSTAEPSVVVVESDIDIEADCAYSGEMRRTICTFTATAVTGTVRSLTVPEAILCSAVVGGDFEKVEVGPSARPTGTGLKSTRQENGAAVVMVELEGEVMTAATATYWCNTDRGELVPVTGPGLRCTEHEESTATGVSQGTGAVVVHAYSCDVASANTEVAWFDVCQAPFTRATFQLVRLEGEDAVGTETQPVDAEGVCHFGDLLPGTYRLTQTDGEWCHAESNSVDDQGKVVVTAAEVATVWIFYCAVTQ